MIRLTLGTSASANAFVSFATAPAIVISSSTVVAKPSTFVSVSTGIEKASQQVKKLSDEAVTLFEGLNKKNEFLFTLVNELVGRRK